MLKCLFERSQSSAPLHYAPLGPLAPRDASSPVSPVFHPLMGAGSESAPAPDPGVSISSAVAPACSAAAAAAAFSPFSFASFQSLPDCSYHRCGTRVPRRRPATSQSPRIGRVAMNCAAVFCLRRTDVLALTTPAALRTPTGGGVNLISVPPTAGQSSCQPPCYPALEGVQGRLHPLCEYPQLLPEE